MDIAEAITRSRSHDEIVECTDTLEEIGALCAEADDHVNLVAQYGYYDIWGTDDDGVGYRLHVRPEEPDPDPKGMERARGVALRLSGLHVPDEAE